MKTAVLSMQYKLKNQQEGTNPFGNCTSHLEECPLHWEDFPNRGLRQSSGPAPSPSQQTVHCGTSDLDLLLLLHHTCLVAQDQPQHSAI